MSNAAVTTQFYVPASVPTPNIPAGSGWPPTTITVLAASGGDDTANLQASLTALPPGGAVMITGRVQVLSANILMPPFTAIISGGIKPCFPSGADYSQISPAIILNPAYTIILQRGCSIEGFSILRQGLINVVDVPSAYLEKAARVTGPGAASVGVQVGWPNNTPPGSTPPFQASDNYISFVNIVGFHTAVLAYSCSRGRFIGVKADCANGLDMQNSGDTLRVENCQLKSYVVQAIPDTPPASPTNSTPFRSFPIASVTNNGGNIQINCSLPGTVTSIPFVTGNVVVIYNMAGAQQLNANGRWTVTVLNNTSFVLNNSVYGAGGFDPISNNATAYANFNNPGFAYKFTNTDDPDCIQCFSHGYDTGFIVRCSTMKLVSGGVEGVSSGVIDPTVIGLQIDTDGTNFSQWGLYADFSADTCGVSVLFNPQGVANTKAVFVNSRLGYGFPSVLQNPLDSTSTNYCIQAITGIIKFVNMNWTGGTTGNLYIGTACQGCIFDENPNLTVYGQSAPALNQFVTGMSIPIFDQLFTDGATGSHTAAAMALTGGDFNAVICNNTGTGTLTTRTAAQMLSDFYATAQIAYTGFNWVFRIINKGSGIITLAPGAGVAPIVGTATIAPNTWADFLGTFTAAIPSTSAAVTIQSIGAGASSSIPNTQYVLDNRTTFTGVIQAGDLTGAARCTCEFNRLGTGALTTRASNNLLTDFVGALPGYSYTVRVVNSGTGVITFTGGINVSVNGTVGGTININNGAWRDFNVTLVNSSSTTFQSIGSGTV